MFTERKCALCGKTQAQGEHLGAWSLLVRWANEQNIKLKEPSSSYLDPRCAAKVREQLK